MTRAIGCAAVLSAALACAGGGEQANPVAGDSAQEVAAASALGDPIAGLTAAEKARFQVGRTQFQNVEGNEDGLGPVFNESSCVACHVGPNGAVGGSNARLETRFGRVDASGNFDPLASYGGSLLQDHAIGAVTGYTYVPEQIPSVANVVAGRRTTPLFGLGLVDAIPDEEIKLIAHAQATFTPGVAGTVAMVNNISTGLQAVGKFGWKNGNPTLFQFSGDAYLNEMGITNPQFPNENCPQGDCSTLQYNPNPGLNDDGTDVQRFTDFMRMLAPPPRGPVGPAELRGEVLAATVGCFDCHVPTLVTGATDIAALSRKVFHPYSDFLLHDMGSLGDGIQQGAASMRQMRTQPLWGVSGQPKLLHDGRALTIDAAILAHDGQGKHARDKYAALKAADKSALLAFLRSL